MGKAISSVLVAKKKFTILCSYIHISQLLAPSLLWGYLAMFGDIFSCNN